MACPLATERVWIEQSQYNDAEKNYFERLSKLLKGSMTNTNSNNNNNDKNKENIQNIVGVPIPSPNDDDELNVVIESPKIKTKNSNRSKKNSTGSSSSELAVVAPAMETITPSTSPQSESVPDNEYNDEKNKKDQSNTKKLRRARYRKKHKEHKKLMAKAAEIGEAFYKKMHDREDQPEKQEEEVMRQNEKEIEDKEPTPPPSSPPPKVDKRRNERQQKGTGSTQCALVSEISKARQHIKNSLERMDDIAALVASPGGDVLERLAALEKQNASLFELTEQLKKCFTQADNRINALESRMSGISDSSGSAKKPTPLAIKTEEEDDGVDLFASDSDEEDEAASKVREQRLAEYTAKKSKKPALIAKSSLVFDVKPWDDETDLKKMEAEIRKIQTDGLLWGVSKFMPVAYGIQKLSITCVVEDDKVSIDWLTEEIEKLDDYVQSIDIAAFNKI